MKRTALVHRDERQIDIRAHAGGKFAFRLFSCLFQTLESLRIVAEINSVFFLELLREPVHDDSVEVIAAKVGIAVGGFHLEHAVSDFENGDIESSAAEVVDRDGFVFLLVQTVCQRCGGRLVDDAFDIKSGDSSGVLGRLSLRIVEVCRNRDDGFRDLFAEIGFRVGFQFLKNHGGDFRRRIALVAGFDVGVAVFAFDHFIRNAGKLILHFRIFSAHESLDGENGVFRIRDSLTFCSLPDEPFTRFRKSYNGRSGIRALRIRNDLECGAVHDSHTTVCRS